MADAILWAWGVGKALKDGWAWLEKLGGAQGRRPPVPASTLRTIS